MAHGVRDDGFVFDMFANLLYRRPTSTSRFESWDGLGEISTLTWSRKSLELLKADGDNVQGASKTTTYLNDFASTTVLNTLVQLARNGRTTVTSRAAEHGSESS